MTIHENNTRAGSCEYNANVPKSGTKCIKRTRQKSIERSMRKSDTDRVFKVTGTAPAAPCSQLRITEETLVKDVEDSRKNCVTPTKSKCRELRVLLSPCSISTTSKSYRDSENDSDEDVVQNSQSLTVSKLRKALEKRRKSKNRDATPEPSPNGKCNFERTKDDFKHDEGKDNFCTSTPDAKRRRIRDNDYEDVFDEIKEENREDAPKVETDDETNRISFSLDLNECETIKMLHSLGDICLTDIELSSIPMLWNCDEQDLTENALKAEAKPLTERSEIKTEDVSEQREKAESTTEATELSSQRSCKEHNEYNASEEFSDESLEEDQHDLFVVARNIVKELAAIEEKEVLPKKLKKKLRNLKIQLRHTVPPQHMIESNAGSHVPTQKQKRLFEKHGPLKKGYYSAMEDKIIKNNWKAFCKTHDWNSKDVKAFLYMRHKNKFYISSLKERKKFVQFLADGLPWRTLYSVYLRFRVLYGDYLRRRYDEKESEKILAYIQNSPHNEKINKKYSDLAKVLKRSRFSVWKRYQILKKGIRENDSKIEWTLPLIARFIKKLLKITLNDDIEDLKDAMIPKVVWQQLEKKLKIDQKVLKLFWLNQLHLQLFCKYPIHMNDVKIKLIEYCYESGISHIKQIVWANVVKYFDGMTSTFLSNIFSRIINAVSFRKTSNDLWRVITFLYETRIPQLRDSRHDKLLPRITYKDGKVEIIDDSAIRIK